MDLPFIVTVEMPADVRNPDKAIEALGGPDVVQKAFSIDSGSLQCNIGANTFLLGCPHKVSNLLVRARRSKRTGKVTTHVEGIVFKVYRFDAMGDFFFTPPEAYARPRTIQEEFIPNQEVYMPPPMFTKWLYPFPYNFQENTFNNSKATTSTPVLSGKSETILRNAHWVPTHIVRFNDATIPCEAPSNMRESLNSVEEEVLKVLQGLFEQRPVWIRASLEEHMPENIRRISWMQKPLQMVAYLWSDGPFRTAYTRLGYDPRLDPEAKKYQTIDFRDPHFRHTDFLVSNPGAVEPAVDCHFRTPPVNKSQIYQLIDVHDATVQCIVKSASETLSKCDIGSGWMGKRDFNQIRAQMKVKSVAMRRVDVERQQLMLTAEAQS